MPGSPLTISITTLRRFILGKQGLFPGRRWRGKEGVNQALDAHCVVQIDPLSVIARNHDLTLFGRVLEYQPADLDRVLFEERGAFDYGGTVMIYPMAELPYFRSVMARKINHPYRLKFAQEHSGVIEQVRSLIQANGPVASRDLAGNKRFAGAYRSAKDTGQALYHLWLAGELLTHSRKGNDRIYDLRERLVPSHLDYAATPQAADDYFALKTFHQLGITSERGWRGWFAGAIERPVSNEEARQRLQDMVQSAKVTQIWLEGDLKTPRYLVSEDLPVLEGLQDGRIPPEWQPLESTTWDEMTFLAPLEIASARGRALPLFDFEYIWEVYKPQHQRRWGYYTLPVLYGDRLVARFDSKLDRTNQTLNVLGFWLEETAQPDQAFYRALGAGFRRFLSFLRAERLAFSAAVPAHIEANLSLLAAARSS